MKDVCKMPSKKVNLELTLTDEKRLRGSRGSYSKVREGLV